MFQITMEKVKNLLRILRGGLDDKAGAMKGPATFCVQQSVTRAIHGMEADGMGDTPECVGHSVNNLGITINDADFWDNDDDRANGIKEFAVAEVGSNAINQQMFEKKLVEKFSSKYPQGGGTYVCINNLVDCCENRAQFLDVIAMAVEVFGEMKSPGCEYLYLCHPRKYSHMRPAIPETVYPQFGAVVPKKNIHDVQ